MYARAGLRSRARKIGVIEENQILAINECKNHYTNLKVLWCIEKVAREQS